MEKLLGFEVVEVSCGASHMLAVTNEHEVFAWGRGDNGRLGLGSQDSHSSPQQVSLRPQYKPCGVLCAIDCSMILTLEGQLLCSGSNRLVSQTIFGNKHIIATNIQLLNYKRNHHLGKPVSGRLCFAGYTLTIDAQLYIRYNKLALDENEHVEEVDIFIPVRSPPLNSIAIKSVAMGTSHAAAITGM